MSRIEEYFEQLERQTTASPVCSESVSVLGDEGVLDGHRRLAALQRELSRQEAVFAAETARPVCAPAGAGGVGVEERSHQHRRPAAIGHWEY